MEKTWELVHKWGEGNLGAVVLFLLCNTNMVSHDYTGLFKLTDREQDLVFEGRNLSWENMFLKKINSLKPEACKDIWNMTMNGPEYSVLVLYDGLHSSLIPELSGKPHLNT